MTSTSASTCLPTASSSSSLLSSPSLVGRPVPSSFVTRNGSRLILDGAEYRAVGPNIYWLGLDENVVPNPSWPLTNRVQEVIAVASAMGANTIRSTTLGVSVGTPLSVQPSLGVVNEKAFAAIDWAVWIAKSYGMRLILPLTDQYDYYHGGIPTFLRFRNLSASSPSDYEPFYDTSSAVYSDFTGYITTLLSHKSNITGLSLAQDPTILAFETGNELGGWGGSASPPPVAWSTAIAKHLKSLAPNTLVISGSYGVRKDELAIAEVDIYSDHYYPPYSYNLRKSASLTQTHSKAFIAGEFDWTNQYYKPIIYLAVLAPVLLAGVPWLMPARWWPWRLSLGCFCCRGRKARRHRAQREAVQEPSSLPPQAWEPLDGGQDYEDDTKTSSVALDQPSYGSTAPPSSPSLFSNSARLNYPPPSFARPPLPRTRPSLLDRSLHLQRWHLSLLIILVLSPILAGVISLYLPTPLTKFLSSLETTPGVSGSFYWSLFGRDTSCCSYVQHNDGYTLHYPSEPGLKGNGDGEAALELTRHAWRMQGASPDWLGEGRSLDQLGVGGLVTVRCPQEALAMPVNSTWEGTGLDS